MIASPGPIAIQLGPISIRWYGLLMAAAIAVGFWLADRKARSEKLPADVLMRVAQWAVLAGFVGARFYEVMFNWDYYGQHPAKIVAVWEGGLAIHGGLLLGSIVGVWLARRWRLPILKSLDVVAPSPHYSRTRTAPSLRPSPSRGRGSLSGPLAPGRGEGQGEGVSTTWDPAS